MENSNPITSNQSIIMTNLLEQYLNQLSEKERQAYEIAKSHLGTSFQLEKSVGFLKWKKNIEKI